MVAKALEWMQPGRKSAEKLYAQLFAQIHRDRSRQKAKVGAPFLPGMDVAVVIVKFASVFDSDAVHHIFQDIRRRF